MRNIRAYHYKYPPFKIGYLKNVYKYPPFITDTLKPHIFYLWVHSKNYICGYLDFFSRGAPPPGPPVTHSVTLNARAENAIFSNI